MDIQKISTSQDVNNLSTAKNEAKLNLETQENVFEKKDDVKVDTLLYRFPVDVEEIGEGSIGKFPVIKDPKPGTKIILKELLENKIIHDVVQEGHGNLQYGIEVHTKFGIDNPWSNSEYTYCTRPDTEEFKKHDEAMDKELEKWLEEHPEPETSELDAVYLCVNGSLHDQWVKDRAKFLEQKEAEYRKNNPEYKSQAEYYEKVQEECNEKNGSCRRTLYL